MIYRKVTGFAAFGLVLSFLATGEAEAKWYLFGKGDSDGKSQIAASVNDPDLPAGETSKNPEPDLEFSQNRVFGGKTAQTTGTVTRRVEKRVRTQKNDQNDSSDLIESTLTMPINILQPMKGTQKGLESLQTPINNLSEPIRNLRPPLSHLDSTIRDLGQPLKGLTKPLSELKESTGALQQPLKSVGSEISSLKKPINELKQPLHDLKTPIEQLGQPVQQLNKPLTALSRPIGELHQPLMDVSVSLTGVKDEINLLREEIGGIKSTVAQIVFYVLCMVTVLCVTALAILFGLWGFISKRKKS